MISLVSIQMTDSGWWETKQTHLRCSWEARKNVLVANSKTPLACLWQFQQHFDQTLTPFPQRESAIVLSECALIWLALTLVRASHTVSTVGGGEQQHAKFTNYHPDRNINELQSLISIIFFSISVLNEINRIFLQCHTIFHFNSLNKSHSTIKGLEIRKI